MILSSRVAHAFIAAYSPRLRGNFLRFQAQYLRRIRIPRFENLSKSLQKETLAAARSSHQGEKDALVQRLYNLTDLDWSRRDPSILTA